jgi:HEAT repeat protein
MKRLFSVACLLLGAAAVAPAAEVSDLTRQLKSPDADQRRAAAKSLFEMGDEARDAVPDLVQALKDKDLFVRRFAAQSLGEIGPDAKSAVKPLAEALGDPKKEVAQAAATALGKIGAAEPLAALAADAKKDPTARRKAIEALGAMKSDARSAVSALTKALKDRDVRVEAAEALGEIGSDASAALKELEAIAGDKKERDRNFKKAVNQAVKKIKQ